MNGFADKGFDEANFSGDTFNAVRSFDAFPKVKESYTQKTSGGSSWTIFLICASVFLTWTELKRWWVGNTVHAFSVEQGVGHDLQINMDLIVAMKCDDLHVNLQDASGDRILAGTALTKDNTYFSQYLTSGKSRLGKSKDERLDRGASPEYREEDVHNYLPAARTTKKFAKTPRLPRGVEADSCRIYGTMHTNKVQGDFHITARGHGYMEFGAHLDHNGKISQLRSFSRFSDFSSLQLLTPHQRTIIWPLLPKPGQSAGQHLRRHGEPFLQVPILPFCGSNSLYYGSQVSTKHRQMGGVALFRIRWTGSTSVPLQQESCLHEPVRRYGAEPSCAGEPGTGSLCQVRH
jgi:hypothetical protein